MTDYRTLIDPDIRAFIDATNRFYPSDMPADSIARRREVYDRMCSAFHNGYPEGVSAETKIVTAGGRKMTIRRYRAMRYDAHCVVLYLHGGGFVVGGLESHDDICAEICHRTGFEVVAVEYRLAPEHPHPAAFEDALAAYQWVCDGYDIPVVLVGDSAGGNLAAALSHAARKLPEAPIGQMLIYPLLGGDVKTGSYAAHPDTPMLAIRDLEFYSEVRSGGHDFNTDPTFLPLADDDYADLPPTAIITAEYDPLSSDGATYRDRIIEAGGRAWSHEEAGLVHGYLRARHLSARARESFTRIVEAIRMLGREEWTFPMRRTAAERAAAPAERAVACPID